MSKVQATVLMDEKVLQEAERVAQSRKTSLDELVEAVLLREVQSEAAHGSLPIILPTHGQGGLLPGVALEDRELMDRLLGEP